MGGPDPGLVLAQQGMCRQELWPDDREQPVISERTLASYAERHRLNATPHPIALDDVRKALSAGSPVHVAMNTGSAFSSVGRSGVFDAAEPPSGRHGRHAMLIVGYTGNYYTVKNSWREEWGDRGVRLHSQECAGGFGSGIRGGVSLKRPTRPWGSAPHTYS